MTTATLLVSVGVDHDGQTGLLQAIDKQIGKEPGGTEIPGGSLRHGLLGARWSPVHHCAVRTDGCRHTTRSSGRNG